MPARLPLTLEQRRAAANPADHAFIVATPGAGKTTVAAERYGVSRYLRRRFGCRTLGVSFARSATQELRQRVQGRWGTRAVDWPNDVMTLDSLHCELVRHLLKSRTLRWPGGHTELTVIDTWRGQANARLLLPQQGWRRVATADGTDVTSAASPITQSTYGIGARAPFEAHLAKGICTHDEIRAVLRAVFRRDDLRPALSDYLRSTTGALIVDEVFDANNLDIALILLAGQSGIPTTLIGDPWQALYEFRGAQPELVPRLVSSQGYETFPVTQSFRFTTAEMQHLATDLRAGRGVIIPAGSVADVDVVLAPEWDMLWQTDDRVLPLSFGRIDNQTDAAIVLLLDQVVTGHFGRGAIFVLEAMTLLDLDAETVRAEGAVALRPVLETLSRATPQATAAAIRQLRSALKELGSPRRLGTLRAASEAVQLERLHALARRLNQTRCVPGMTVHQAKGKEWRAVGARLKPGQIERLATGLSEASADDRLIYVALTRAREAARLV
jgi:DNA helicase-2/ATP-dependent DNA helicase PcrA